MVKRNCNSARWSYVNELSEKLSTNNSKPFWKYINSKCKGTNDLILLKVGDLEITDDMEIAESMKIYLSLVFTNETFDSFPIMNRVVEEKFCDIQCSVDEVEHRTLRNINVSKSPGTHNIRSRILKECTCELAPPLASIFNRLFSSGTLPDDWKIAHIVPIDKNNSKFKRDRSIMSKIAEK